MPTAVLTILTFPLKIVSSEKPLKRTLFVLVVFVILPLLAFYLFQMGELIKNNYLIKNHQSQIQQIAESNMSLQASAFNLLSLDQAENEIASMGFVKVGKVKYIPLLSNYLAKNKTR